MRMQKIDPRFFLRALALVSFPLVTSALSLGCNNAGAAPVAPDTPVEPTDDVSFDSSNASASENISLTRQVLDLTNSYRRQYGLRALTLNSQLNRAAQAYAEAMAYQGFFSHTGLDGSTPGSRISGTGYNWSTFAENIAYGYRTPRDVITGWINSPGHRANLVGSDYLEIGIGVATTADGTGYWVQDFGAR
jgi:uncharacterized protein YkwD